MSEQRYMTGSDSAYVWHTNPECPLVGDTELEPVPEPEVPDPAHPCAHSECANGIDAQTLRNEVSNSVTD